MADTSGFEKARRNFLPLQQYHALPVPAPRESAQTFCLLEFLCPLHPKISLFALTSSFLYFGLLPPQLLYGLVLTQPRARTAFLNANVGWWGIYFYCSNSPRVLHNVMLVFRGIFILPLLCAEFQLYTSLRRGWSVTMVMLLGCLTYSHYVVGDPVVGKTQGALLGTMWYRKMYFAEQQVSGD